MFQKGHPGYKPKGKPNKRTSAIKEAVTLLLHDNRENISEWLERVAKKDPGRALELVAKFAEFVLPKQSRIQAVDEEGKAMPPVQIMLPPREIKEVSTNDN